MDEVLTGDLRLALLGGAVVCAHGGHEEGGEEPCAHGTGGKEQRKHGDERQSGRNSCRAATISKSDQSI